MEERKLTKEDIDRVRGIKGFPIAKDEDIIALSRPPYYTACPNPFIPDFIREHGTPYDEATDDYHREPFAADISEGKKDPVYNAHSYHTKVPYKAIMRYILHYTNPGDIIYDGFCGSGMTAFAAQMCGCPDRDFELQLKSEMNNAEFGSRSAVICDLSPAATYISDVFNAVVDLAQFLEQTEAILDSCVKECGWMYETIHTVNGKVQNGIDGKATQGHVNYTVWSDVFVCPSCSKEFSFWDAAVDKSTGGVRDIFECPHCRSRITKKECDNAKAVTQDTALRQTVTMIRQVPVLINYSVGRNTYEKVPDETDMELLDKIEQLEIPYWYPTDRMPEGGETRRNDKFGITHIHQFFIKRNLYALSCFWNKVDNIDVPQSTKNALRSLATGVMMGVSKLQRYRMHSTFPNMILSGTMYIGSMIREWNVLDWINGKYKSIARMKSKSQAFSENIRISTTSSTHVSDIPNNSIDYIFTDPPFGGNLGYSELSFMWESWLRVITNNGEEAIINGEQQKALPEYQSLMEQCFVECHRILKPGRWITIEFHNSKNSVWNAISEAILRAGFVIADIRILDKKQSSFKQITAASAVKQDLVISAYKPKEAFVRQFTERAGDPEMAWEFVRQHLQNVPIAPDSTGKIEVVSERQDYLLFDRMVAFHIMNGIPIPMDAHAFYAGLRDRFIQRDGMFFLPDQVNEYDERRQKMELQDQQLSLFITDEKSAIIWLNVQLGQLRQTIKQIQPKFLQDWHRNKFEQMPELLDMLKENFLCDDEGKWYVPNLSDQADLEKLRRKRLLKDFFDIYAKGTGRIKNARTEAIRVGFDECWKERNYSLIVKVGNRLPEKVLQEDPALLMYYDNAANRM
ncbi:MAG: DNA methyltransferase [Eubacteriales bacterium]|nr:DNA methyltransferase [Eubacteriales bacterium]